MASQLNMKPLLNPNWFVLQRKCADPCIHRLAITAREGSVIFIIIELWAETPTGIWNKMSSVSGHLSGGDVCVGNRHLFGQLSKGHPSPAPSGNDGKQRKTLSLEKYIHPQGFLRSLQPGRVNILLYGPIHLLYACSSFDCKFSVIRIPQVSSVHVFTGFHLD